MSLLKFLDYDNPTDNQKIHDISTEIYVHNTFSNFLKSNSSELMVVLNQELITTNQVVAQWRKYDPDLTLRQYEQKYYGSSKESAREFASFLGATVGCLIHQTFPRALGIINFPYAATEFTSNGDMVITINGVEKRYELKTTGSQDNNVSIQGSTHSPKENGEISMIRLSYHIDRDVKLKYVEESGRFITKANLSIFNNTNSYVSIGEPKPNSSRTEIKFPSESIEECHNACVFGDVKQNRKWVHFIKGRV